MPWIFELAKWTHVAAASAALTAGPLAMVTRKGGRAHRLWGQIYFWSMAAVFASALVMSLYKPVLFLIGVAVLSFYSTLSGVRVLARKRADGPRAGAADWVAAAAALAMGGGLVLWSAALLLGGQGETFAALGVVFGAMTCKDALDDIRRFRGAALDRHFWWYFHMQRMLGSFIGLTTALLVQVVAPRLLDAGMDPGMIWVVWVAPTLLLTPAMLSWIGYYRRRLEGSGARTTAAA